MTRRDTPTVPAGCPDERAHDCAADAWGLDALGYQPPRTTVPMPAVDLVAAARGLLAERRAHMERVAAIDDAVGYLRAVMTPAQRAALDGVG